MKIKDFKDGSSIEYGHGKFDDWCVFLVAPDGTRKPPLDTEYFCQIEKFAKKYGNQRVYKDFIKLYNLTQREIEESVLKTISEIAETYGEDEVEFDTVFTTLYMGMIAEEQKAFTHLGKRIKRLGIHQILACGKNPLDAANFMRGMNWKKIDNICKYYGF